MKKTVYIKVDRTELNSYKVKVFGAIKEYKEFCSYKDFITYVELIHSYGCLRGYRIKQATFYYKGTDKYYRTPCMLYYKGDAVWAETKVKWLLDHQF